MPILLSQNIPTASVCATRTTILLGGKPIVITEFFALLNITFSHNPDGALGDQDFTVRVARMVDITGFVLQGFPVNIIVVIEGKDILIALIYSKSTPHRHKAQH